MTSLQRLGLSSAVSALFVPVAAWLTDFAWLAVVGLTVLFFLGIYLSSFYLPSAGSEADLQTLLDKTAQIKRESAEFQEKLIAVLELYQDDYGAELQHYKKTGRFLADQSDKFFHGMLVLSNKLSEFAGLLTKKPRLIFGNERIFILMPLAHNLLSKLSQYDIQNLTSETQTRSQEGMRLLIQATQDLFQSSKSAHEKDIAIEVRVLEETLKLM